MEGDWGGALGTLIGLLCGGIILLVFIGGGIRLIYTAVSGKRKVQASQHWPSTSGKILDAKISTLVSTDSDGQTTYTHYLDARYAYEVDGKQYVNDRRTIGPLPKRVSPRRAQETLDRYPVGGTVPVYYNPANPQEAVLEREAPLSNLSLIVGIIMLLLFGCMGCTLLYLLSRMLPDLIARMTSN